MADDTYKTTGPVPPEGNEPAEGTIAPATDVDEVEELPQPEQTFQNGETYDQDVVPVEDRAQAPDRVNPDDPEGLSLQEVADQVMRGDWGDGQERRLRLDQAGYDHVEVNNLVNERRRQRFDPSLAQQPQAPQ